MNAVEFTAKLGTEPILKIPQEAASRLPKTGTARVIVLTPALGEAAASWHEVSAHNLVRAYGEAEPEYTVADLKQ